MPKHAPPPRTPRETEADYSEAEIARRRDETARRMIATPRKPNTELKQAKRKAKKKGAKAPA